MQPRDLTDTGATIVMATLFNPAPLLSDSLASHVEPRITAMNAVVRSLSAQHGVLCVDGATSINASNSYIWSADRKHPNGLGHLLIARGVVDALSRHTGEPLAIAAVQLTEELTGRYGLVPEELTALQAPLPH
ncbi:hypothetical protein GCM10008955_40100 [Deinococcus malanensis]|uniref:SGNH hydrolase-type esterase domain-containing protein n=1 Tax=Deinococcus malanensis TaxID=1706855 RepID=A0ABQ2F4S8_9DEIO|nr:hypothetical protein [Deinococcus malanensis]GGK42325.1 hypothetical protein GCM10008955_40100 [Deinococcus malanensis]